MKVTVLLFVFVLFIGPGCVSAQRDILFSMCDFPLAETYRQANLSFTQIYRIRVDSKGIPDKFERVMGKETYVSDKLAEACLSKWRFYGFSEGKVFIASFRWDHGLGWTRVNVIGNGIYRKMVSDRDESK